MNYSRIFLLTAVVALLQLQLCFAQAPSEAEARYNEAWQLFDKTGRIEESNQIWRLMADDYAGTYWGSKALLTLAEWNPDEATVVYQRIISDYPGTEAEFAARVALIGLESGDDSESALLAYDQLLQSLGAPALDQILNGDRAEAGRVVKALEFEKRKSIGSLLNVIWVRIVQSTGVGDEQEKARGLPLALFIEETFASDFPELVDSDTIILSLPGPPRFPTKSAPPEISFLSPTNGAITGPTPVVAIQVSNTINCESVDLAALDIFLDDQSVKESTSFQVSYNSDASGTESFETVSIEFQPEPLSNGPHSIRIRAQSKPFNTESVEVRERTLNFTVTSSVGTTTLPTTKDSTLRAKKPHRNEGANPRLFLSHRLESRGKSQNPIVGFDLANEDLTGLTKATLVMNIQDCDLPRRWGQDGRSIIVCAVNEPWVEGNGNKYRVSGGKGKTKGQGQGVTWFSPVDEKIQNNRPNGSVQWDGARSVTGQPTAPPVLLTNGQTGNVEFDVTQDVLAGFQDGWVIKKQDETKFGNIRFYSKEGAGGDAKLTPRLILEFGSSTAQTNEAPAAGVMARLGFSRGKLESRPSDSELPSVREQLQDNPVAAFAGETLVGAIAGSNPALKMASKVAYRSWLGQGLG